MTEINYIQIKNVGKHLVNYLNYLPVHKLTKYRLEKIIKKNSAEVHLDKINILFTIAKLCKEHEESCQTGDKRRQYKVLQSIIWNIYFQWDNNYVSTTRSAISNTTTTTTTTSTSNHVKRLYEYPPYLRPLLRTAGTTIYTYNGLLNNWPLEYHYDILYSNETSKKITTLRDMWLQGHADAVEKTLLNVGNHKHSHHQPNVDADVDGSDAIGIGKKNHDFCKMIKPILLQCYFLNNNLWTNDNRKKLKPIVPIVEIPFNVKGNIIAEKRIMNLIRDKLKTLTLILTKQWPAIYDEKCIEEMLMLLQLSSFTDNCTNNVPMGRDLLRLHERTFKNRMYRVTATPEAASRNEASNGSNETGPFQQQEEIQFERIF